MGKNIVKGTTQMSGHSLKFHFYMFEESQVKHNSLDCHNFFGIFFINLNFICSKLDTNQIFFACSKHSNLENG
jgi:hypothetical protein